MKKFFKLSIVMLSTLLILNSISCANGSNDELVLPPPTQTPATKETVATPTFSVAEGAVNSGISVTITCATEGAKIYYTTDGSEPTASSTEYTAAISVTSALTIKAIAIKDGMNDSAVASASYTVKGTVATPTFSVAEGAVNSGTSVTITCATEGAKIYYTTDGSEPTASSTEYTAAISVTPPLTIKAIAIKDGMNNSTVASASYTVKGTAAMPVFSIGSSAVNSGTSVTITCATEGAKIYYTTDGSEPTTSNTEYTSAISVTPPVTIKAIAIKDGLNNSAVANASYTVKGTVATPVFNVKSGVVESGRNVELTCTTEDTKIYYTTDGTEPTASSTEYKSPISVTAAVTIKAIAVKDGMNDSAVASASYKMPREDFVIVPGRTVIGEPYYSKWGVFPEGRTVTLSSFFMGKYEVTQEQYKSVMEGQKVTVDGTEYTLADSPSYCFQGSTSFKIDSDKDHANYPVDNVTWFDAVYYCNVLSVKEGLEPCYTITVTDPGWNGSPGHITGATVEFDKTKNGYRLPTEAEWEYAARGGDPSKPDWNYAFSGADLAKGTEKTSEKNSGLDSVGWYMYNNISGITQAGEGEGDNWLGSHEVGKKKPNALGIYDMSGNAFEWCYDWNRTEVAVPRDVVTDPIGIDSGKYRALHGGCWDFEANCAIVTDRNGDLPGNRQFWVGFRICCNAN